jgi:hypothetical protein
MKREDDPKLWDLLGHSPEPKISPFFARNVAREVRALGGNLRRWFSIRRLVPATTVAVALIAVLFLQRETPMVQGTEAEYDLYANVDPQDYELVADLNDLVGSEESTNSLEETILR